MLGSHLYVTQVPPRSLMNWYPSDDSYYNFKVAQNIAEGHGVTFDRISRTNGFHPLWMAVCVPVFSLARHDLYLPLRLLVMVSALVSAGSGILLYRLLRQALSTPLAVLVSTAWVLLPGFTP